MNIKQISVFLENKPGSLEKVLKILADADVNILTLNIAEMTDYGILRMIVNRPEKAFKVLHDAETVCKASDVLGIVLQDSPGSLFKMVHSLSRKGINIEYMYAFTEKKGDKAVMILRFEDIEKAKENLLKEGYNLMKHDGIICE